MAASKLKNALLVAFHFPPMQGSSGLQRTLKFCRYLPDYGWQPAVLTVPPRVYPDLSDDLLDSIPAGLQVVRAFALDTAQHMSLFGRYPSFLALPDRWVSWLAGGLVSGLRLIRTNKPQVIWSTFPVGTAHLLALMLHRLSGVPWLADIRDPMVEADYPPDRTKRQILAWIERQTVREASRVIVTTQGTARRYQERYADAAGHIACIPNGFDELDFQNIFIDLSGKANAASTTRTAPVTLLHSGIVYLSERDPSQLFAALDTMFQDGRLERGDINVVFRACRNEDDLGALVNKYGLRDVVSLLPPIPYEQALREMYEADGLLLLQGGNCNDQVPAKVFEYMRTGKPLLALTDPAGDTAGVVRGSGVDAIAPLDDSYQIATRIDRFINEIRTGEITLPDAKYAAGFSRQSQTMELARLFDAVLAESGD